MAASWWPRPEMMLWSSTVRRAPVFLMELRRVSSKCLMELTATSSMDRSGLVVLSALMAPRASVTIAPEAAMVSMLPVRRTSERPYS